MQDMGINPDITTKKRKHKEIHSHREKLHRRNETSRTK